MNIQRPTCGRNSWFKRIGVFIFLSLIISFNQESMKNALSSSSSTTSVTTPHQHAILDDKTLSPLLHGQWIRLQLMEKNIAPILPGPKVTKETILHQIQTKNETYFQSYHNKIGEWKYTLFSRLDRIRLQCGTLCQLNTIDELAKYQSPLETNNNNSIIQLTQVPDVNCKAIVSMEEIDAGDLTFPRNLTDELKDFYSFNNSFPVLLNHRIFQDAYLGGDARTNVWKEEDVDNAVLQIKNQTHHGTYGLAETIALTKNLEQVDMKGKSVLVIGSENPWVEAICLYHGAAKVTTLEYGKIISHHPKIETETPSSIRQKYIDGKLDLFDGIVTHSSIEHSGLGRYGDALNPWGDVLAIARGWCLCKPKAFMWIGVPTGQDGLKHNWHRIYGRVRWSLLAANWKQVGKDINFNDWEELVRQGLQVKENHGFVFEKVEAKENK